ncbi:MAG: contact-dependent growth inhibition system immunity protein [Alphaproteobacteria bacterium]|jgi:hypothetical protein
MRTEKDWIKRAYAQMNSKYINIGPYSGYRSGNVDFDRMELFLKLDSQDNELGDALLLAIENSTFLSLEEAERLRMDEQSYPNWVKKTMKNQGHKTKGEMFKPMFSCDVRKETDGFLFYPTHQRAIMSWEGNEYTKANKFTIPLTATATEMGAALRRCLALCTSKFDLPKDS